MAGARMRRVNGAIKEVVSAHIAEGLSDPRIGFVTVTAVDTSPDLSHARVYVTVLGDERARVDALAGLDSARGFLQAQLAAELTIKRTPTLRFVYDESTDRGIRIGRLIDAVAGAEGPETPGAPGAPGSAGGVGEASPEGDRQAGGEGDER